ncbi:plasmid maintenance protein CcdB [Aromatoleum toluvorans]|uniref:Toxin CcdB n=1 Tax=Aromatoleum toluvorans TaxID=92002 RepID=A0ABX1Q497_9RHOO|nr:CcdB family protein [Aromatoleum toluvorans]NMG45320.1 plasmid maintenance protein CcdB [Aromatoleum toluvorans]
MARFDVYRNPEGDGYLVDLQANLLDHLNTRIVAPLLPVDRAPKPAATLNPVLNMGSEQVVMLTQFMAAVPSQILKSPVARIDSCRAEITAAVDLLFQGF